jgi:hypothetical protein
MGQTLNSNSETSAAPLSMAQNVNTKHSPNETHGRRHARTPTVKRSQFNLCFKEKQLRLKINWGFDSLVHADAASTAQRSAGKLY